MFVKNFLTSGDFLTVVPVGYPMTIQYDTTGTIEKVYKGWSDDRVLLDKAVLHQIMKTNLVPRNVSLKNGSTLVSGVLYTNKKYVGSGKLPDCVMDQILDGYLKGEGTFNFFAGSVESHSAVFRGASPIRQWLTFAGFHVLPGYVIPHDITEAGFEKLVRGSGFTFTYPLISDYIVFHNGEPQFHSVGLKSDIITTIIQKVTPLGYVVADIEFKDRSSTSWNYSDMLRLKLAPGSVVIRHEEGKPIYSYENSDVVISDKLTCTFCGKLIKVPSEGRVRCDDAHCNSRLYYDTRKFLEELSIPPALTHSRYIEVITAVGPNYSVLDILNADEYKDVTITTTLSKLLHAMIPVELSISEDTISAFCNRCNNKVATVEYYMDNTSKIFSDLKFEGDVQVKTLVNWLDSDPSNLLDINTALHHARIKITNTNKKFDGAPIFRNRTIAITGDFNRGSSSEVCAILSSYSAKIVTDSNIADIGVDCVLVGDRKENVNGHMIKDAKKLNIPIFTESEFFSQYAIDEDMAANL